MKFVHIADVHLDMPFTCFKNNREWIKRRKIEQKYIFRKTIDLVKDENADVLFIAGDLFEEKFVEDETVLYVISCLKEISNTRVYITPGNHDPLMKSSPYERFEWPENVFIFSSEVGKDVFDTFAIYGLGFQDFKMDTTAVKDIAIEKDKVNILITHGTLDGASHMYHDIKSEWLSKFDYVALGHIHMKKVDNSKIVYPGSLVAGGFDERGEHGLVLGTIDKLDGKVKLQTQFIKMDDSQFETKILDISTCQSVQEVMDRLNLQNQFYSIVLTGIRNIDTSKIEESLLLTDKNVCEVKDQTHVDYDLEEIAKQKTLKGIFTKKMLEELKENPAKEEMIHQAIDAVYRCL